VLAALASIAPRTTFAQQVLGPGDDGFVLPRGVLRVTAGFSWNGMPDRYGSDGSRIPLGAQLSGSTLGVADIPQLAGSQSALRELAGQPTLSLSLGTVRASLDRSRITTPIILEAGLTSRVTAFVNVPYVRTRTDVALDVNPRGSSAANVGLNPATTLDAARARNAAVGTALRGAATSLEQRVASCQTDPSGVGCAAILADVPGATALVSSARTTATQIERTYGTATDAGTPFVPTRGSALEQAIEARLQQLGASLGALLGAEPTIGTPFAAQVPVTATELQAIVGNCETGLCAAPIQTVQRSHIGDIELGARVRLLDTFGGDERARLAPSGFNARLTAGALVRLGTGQLETPDDLTGLGTGDGQTDIEARVATDLFAGRRFWITVIGRYGSQLADRPRVRVPAYAGQVLLPVTQEAVVDRKLGSYAELEATPHWELGEYFAAFASWRYRAKAADTYRGGVTTTDSAGATSTFDAAILGTDTESREQHLGIGIVYSTVAAFEHGRAKLPFELSLLRTQTVSGRNAPYTSAAMAQLRVYTRLFGGSPLAH
jgi:hypothetical protein